MYSLSWVFRKIPGPSKVPRKTLSFSRNRSSGHFWGYVLFFLICIAGCEAKETSLPFETPQTKTSVHSSSSPKLNSSPKEISENPRIVAFGNSLTAGLGVSPDQSYPAQLQRRLNNAGYHYKVINAGVSGDTTAGGLRRLNWILKSQPSIVIVELGANDGLRGQPLAAMYSNLNEIITTLKESGAKVVLAGMKIPPNYGQDYTTGFASMFEQLARRHSIRLIPFFLEGVAARPQLNQADGLHPTSAGYQIVADNVMTAIEPLLKAGSL